MMFGTADSESSILLPLEIVEIFHTRKVELLQLRERA